MKLSKRYVSLNFVIIFLISILLFGCDSAYPQGKLRVKSPNKIKVGSFIEMKVIYPNTGGTLVSGWKDVEIEAVEGNELVEINNLNIQAVKEGKTKIEVRATTVLSDGAYEDGEEDRIYTALTEIEIVP